MVIYSDTAILTTSLQDTNSSQYAFAKALSNKGRITVVGDPDQCSRCCLLADNAILTARSLCMEICRCRNLRQNEKGSV